MILEKDIENMFVDWVTQRGGAALKWTGSRKKFDRVVITHTGRVLLIEFKRPGGPSTPHQEELWGLVTDANRRGIYITARDFCPIYLVDSYEMAKAAYRHVANDLWLSQKER